MTLKHTIVNGAKAAPYLRAMLITGTASVALICGAQTAHAQAERAIDIANPSRISDDLLKNDTLPTLSPDVQVTESAPLAAPEGADKITFELKSLEIDGASAYKAEELAPFYNDRLGTTVTLSDVYAIANALTTKYRNDGYILTQIVVPPQTINTGTVKLQVVEGFIDQIAVEGELGEREAALVKNYADNMRTNGILNAREMERNLLLINDLPGVTARSVLSPSKTVIGASDLTVLVERDSFDGAVEFNNHGSRYLGAYQGIFEGNLNSLFGQNERIGSQFVMSGDKDRVNELMFGALSYQQPISRFGTMLEIEGSLSDTKPGYTLDEFDVKGYSKFLKVGVSHPFIRSRTENLFGRVSFDARNLKSKNNLEPDTRVDHIRSLRVGSTYQYIDSLFGVGANAADIEISQGMNVFDSSEENDSRLTRAAGDPYYTKMNLELQRIQRVTQSVNLVFAGKGQWASTPLLSSEEFGVGGMDFGRGYDSSEIVGDDGLAGKVELQWNKPYEVQYLDDYQLFTYLDAGRVWNKDATTSAGKRDSLVSLGIGAQADLSVGLTAGVGVALPLTRERDTTSDNDPRYYFSVSHKF